LGADGTSSSEFASVSINNFSSIFVKRYCPRTTVAQLPSELYKQFLYVNITWMVTKHANYISFHLRLPLEKLDVVLTPTFWPDRILVKRFIDRLLPEKTVGLLPNAKN